MSIIDRIFDRLFKEATESISQEPELRGFFQKAILENKGPREAPSLISGGIMKACSCDYCDSWQERVAEIE